MTDGTLYTTLESEMFDVEAEDLIECEETDIESIAEAEGFYTDLETEVMLKSQDAGADYNQDQIKAMTDLTLGLHLKSLNQFGDMSPSKLQIAILALNIILPAFLIIYTAIMWNNINPVVILPVVILLLLLR